MIRYCARPRHNRLFSSLRGAGFAPFSLTSPLVSIVLRRSGPALPRYIFARFRFDLRTRTLLSLAGIRLACTLIIVREYCLE